LEKEDKKQKKLSFPVACSSETRTPQPSSTSTSTDSGNVSPRSQHSAEIGLDTCLPFTVREPSKRVQVQSESVRQTKYRAPMPPTPRAPFCSQTQRVGGGDPFDVSTPNPDGKLS